MRLGKVVAFWVLLWLGIGVCYRLMGGHVHLLMQPFLVFMIAAIYGIAFVGTGVSMNEKSEVRRLNKICFWTCATLIPLLGFVHVTGFFDQSMLVIGEHLAAAAVGVALAIVTYLSVELGMTLDAKKSPEPRVWYQGQNLVASFGLLCLVAAIVLSVVAMGDNYYNQPRAPAAESE